MNFENTLSFANIVDHKDPLRHVRDEFYIPKNEHGDELLYFTGNSLGLQPKKTKDYILQELEDWKNLGSKGHVSAKRPWMKYHHHFKKPLSQIVGAHESEVVSMNSLTTNLHLLMISFYRPTSSRYKILMLNNAFPSDHYAIESQVKYHGFDPKDAIIGMGPMSTESLLDENELLQQIELNKDCLALVLIEGVSYLTGQAFDIKTLAQQCQKYDITLGVDGAHAVGNIELALHDWGVDFAAWCSYKYLNGSPGCVGGAFVHQKHSKRFDLPRLSGWWGHNEARRFLMESTFDPMEGVDGWQLSNVPVLTSAALLSSLSIFETVGMKSLIEKSHHLTGFLTFLLQENCKDTVKIITPLEESKRGCQLSLEVKGGKSVFEKLIQSGVVCDWREPSVIRLAPVPLYNTFTDVYQFVQMLSEVA
ncbi:MAG: kynureninase [Bdellovibrionales bacterium]|nr:kynureninase [Bdellovibrionales bacterium]